MVLSEARNHLFKRNYASSSNDARLAHVSAQHLALISYLLNEIKSSGHNRPHRRSQALREAHLNRVRISCNLSWINLELHCSMKQPGAIQMQASTSRADKLRNFLYVIQWEDYATAQIMGIFQANKIYLGCKTACLIELMLQRRERQCAIWLRRHRLQRNAQ